MSHDEHAHVDQSLYVSRRDAGAMVVITLGGELDRETAPALAEALDGAVDESEGPVVVDAFDLRFIDSAGLTLFARTYGRLASRGRILRIRSTSGVVRKAFDVASLTFLLEPAAR